MVTTTATLTVQDDYRGLASLLNVELLKLNNYIDYGFCITKGVLHEQLNSPKLKKTISLYIHDEFSTFDCTVLKVIVSFCDFYKLDCFFESDKEVLIFDK